MICKTSEKIDLQYLDIQIMENFLRRTLVKFKFSVPRDYWYGRDVQKFEKISEKFEFRIVEK